MNEEHRTRASGWQHAKLSGHSNEARVKELLESDPQYLAAFLQRIGYGNETVEEISVGGLHERNVPGVAGRTTKSKTDLKIRCSSGRTINVSIKKSPGGQVYFVKAELFIRVFEAQFGRTIPADVKRAIRLFWAAADDAGEIIEAYGNRRDEKSFRLQVNHRSLNAATLEAYDAFLFHALRDWFAENAYELAKLSFSMGAAADETEWSEFVWYINLLDENDLDAVFRIEDICRSAAAAAEEATDYGEKYLCRLGVPYRSIRRDQICISDLANHLNRGNDVELCPPVPEVLGPLHMMPYVCEPFSSSIQEATFEKLPKSKVKKFAARQHSRAFTEELDRIWEGEGRPFRGHPVLYSIVCDSRKKNENLTEFLLPVLHGAGRLPANRVCHLEPYQRPLPGFILKDLYRAQGGASIVVDLHSEPSEGETRTMLEALARLAREYRSKVLTVFRACTDDEEALSALKELTQGLPILKLTEDSLSRTEAKRMLKDLADQAEMSGVSFADKLPAEQTSFSETELRALFNKWQDEYLCTEIYPQYAGVQLEDTAGEKAKAPQTSA